MNDDIPKVVSVEMMPNLSLKIKYNDGSVKYTSGIFSEAELDRIREKVKKNIN